MLRALAGGSLFGESWGPSPARVLALHGWERTHEDYRPLFGEAQGPVGVVAPDLPGFGATPAPPGPWGSEQYADALCPLFVEPRGEDGDAGMARPGGMLAPAVVVGHS